MVKIALIQIPLKSNVNPKNDISFCSLMQLYMPSASALTEKHQVHMGHLSAPKNHQSTAAEKLFPFKCDDVDIQTVNKLSAECLR